MIKNPPKQEPQKKFKFNKYSPFVLFILFCVVIVLGRAVWGLYLKEAESRKNVAEVASEFKLLQERKQLLQSQNEKLNTEEGVEEELRKKFQIAKPGENLMVVVNKPLPPTENDQNKGFFSKMWSNVSGVFKKK